MLGRARVTPEISERPAFEEFGSDFATTHLCRPTQGSRSAMVSRPPGVKRSSRLFAASNPPWPGSSHGCPVRLFAAAIRKCFRRLHNVWSPVAGLVPATHVFAKRSVKRKEGEDNPAQPPPRDSRVVRRAP